MKNVILILSISLVLIISIYFIKILQNDNIDNFASDIRPERFTDETQKDTDVLISKTKEQNLVNKANINAIGQERANYDASMITTLDATNKAYQKNITDILKKIQDRDVLRFYHTKTNDDETNRWIHPDYKNKKCKSEELDLSGGAQCNDKDKTIAQDKCTKICANHCNLNDECVSFNYQKSTQTCKLSSLCSLNNLDTSNPNDDDFDLYFKKKADANSAISQYTLYGNRKCTNDKVSLNRGERKSLNDCAQSCTDNSQCISFDYNKNNRICRLSKECYDQNAKDSNNHNLYVKKSLIIHPYNRTINEPCRKKFLIQFARRSPSRFYIGVKSNKAVLLIPPSNKDEPSQIFELIHTCKYGEEDPVSELCNNSNSNEGFLKNLNNQYLYFDNTNGVQDNLPILVGKLPNEPENKLNYQWIFKPDGAIVSKFKNRITQNEYAIFAKDIHLHWTYGIDPSSRYAFYDGQGTFNRSKTEPMHIIESKGDKGDKGDKIYGLHLKQYINSHDAKWRKEYINIR